MIGRGAARVGRAVFGGGAFMVLAAALAAPRASWALRIDCSSVKLEVMPMTTTYWVEMSPGDNCLVGSPLRLTLELENNTGRLGNMRANEVNGAAPAGITSNLAAGITDSATMLTVVSNAAFSNYGWVKINSELMKYNTKEGTDKLLFLWRGMGDTAAAAHNAGDPVEEYGVGLPDIPGAGLDPPMGPKINTGNDDACTQNRGDLDFWPGQYWIWPRLGSICAAPLTGFPGENCPNNLDAKSPVNLLSADDVDTFDYNNYAYGLIAARGCIWMANFSAATLSIEIPNFADINVNRNFGFNFPQGTVQDGAPTQYIMVEPGDVMVAFILARNPVSITDPAGWTTVDTVTNGGLWLRVAYKVALPAEAGPYDWTFGAVCDAGGVIVAYENVDTASPISAGAGQATANGISHSAPSISPADKDTMLVAAFGTDAVADFFNPASMVDMGSLSGWVYNLNVMAAAEPWAEAVATGIRTATSSAAGPGVAYMLALKPGITAQKKTVVWKFEARKTWPSLDFDVLALNSDDWGNLCGGVFVPWIPAPIAGNGGDFIGFVNSLGQVDVTEGSYVNCGFAGCPNVFGDGTNSELLAKCWGGTIAIVSPLQTTTYITVMDPGTRPPAPAPFVTAFVGDTIKVETFLENVGLMNEAIDPNVACVEAFDAGDLTIFPYQLNGGCKGANQVTAGTPPLPVTVPPGGTKLFSWTFSLTGGLMCGILPGGSNAGTVSGTASVFWSSEIRGSGSTSVTLFVTLPPLAITGTLWVDYDDDGTADLPLGPGATIYYMSEDVVEARFTFINAGGDTFDVDPIAAISLQDIGAMEVRSGPTPAGPFLLGPGGSQTVAWRFARNASTGSFSQCALMYTKNLSITAGARGVCLTLGLYMDTMPFSPSDGCFAPCSPAPAIVYSVPETVSISKVDFDITAGFRSKADRTVVIDAPGSPIVQHWPVNPPPGPPPSGSIWITSGPTPAIPQPWLPGETKTFTWKAAPKAIGDVRTRVGLNWGVPYGACIKGCRYSPLLDCFVDFQFAVTPPNPLEVWDFRATPAAGCADTNEFVRLEMDLFNSSAVYAISVTLFCGGGSPATEPGGYAFPAGSPPAPVASPSPMMPVFIPPSQVITVTWYMSAYCYPAPPGWFPGSYFFSCSPAPPAGPVTVAGYLLDGPDTDSGILGPVSGNPPLYPAVTRYMASAPTCSIWTDSAEYSVGMPIRVFFSVSNEGGEDLVNFTVTMTAARMAGAGVRFVSGPTPAAPATLFGQGTCMTPAYGPNPQLFMYEFQATRPGKVVFTGRSDAQDGQCGVATTIVNAMDAAASTVTLADNSGFSYGGIIRIDGEYMTFSGKGPGGQLYNLGRAAMGSDAAPHAAGAVATNRKMSSCTARQVVIASAAQLTCKTEATPLVTMTASCTGCPPRSDCNLVTGFGCITVTMEASDFGDIAVQDAQPSPGFPESSYVNQCNLAQVCPAASPVTGRAALIGAPPEAVVPGTIPSLSTVRYTWTYSPTGLGCVQFLTSIKGKDAATKTPMSCGTYSGCVEIKARYPVEMSLVPVAEGINVAPGQEFTVMVQVCNPGETPAALQGGEPSLQFFQAGTGANVTDHFDVNPPSPETLAVGQCKQVAVAVKAHKGSRVGTVELRLSQGDLYIAQDMATGAPVAAVDTTAAPLYVNVMDMTNELKVLSNPGHIGRGRTVSIMYRIADRGGPDDRTLLKIYSLTGELVKTLVDKPSVIEQQEIRWDGRNEDGQMCSGGIFLVRLEGPKYSSVKKLAVVK